jgi:Endosomal/lysosomal potassium channel TMEM175
MIRRIELRDRDFAGFRLRGNEVTRLESFSDAVFGFALTLLVVSLDVPKSFDDLVSTMRGFPAFAICFLLLAIIWNSHYKFCRRYGLDDGVARFLTCVMLFVVLFYVYPLKFLFNVSITGLLFNAGPALSITGSQLSMLLVIYGLGFAAVYGTITLLYLHAWRLRDALELNDLEKSDTRYVMFRLVTLVAFGLLTQVCLDKSRRSVNVNLP